MKFGQKMSKRHKIKVGKFELDCLFIKKVITKKLRLWEAILTQTEQFHIVTILLVFFQLKIDIIKILALVYKIFDRIFRILQKYSYSQKFESLLMMQNTYKMFSNLQ